MVKTCIKLTTFCLNFEILVKFIALLRLKLYSKFYWNFRNVFSSWKKNVAWFMFEKLKILSSSSWEKAWMRKDMTKWFDSEFVFTKKKLSWLGIGLVQTSNQHFKWHNLKSFNALFWICIGFLHSARIFQ